MVSNLWVVAIGFGAAQVIVSAAAGQVAQSTPPSSGFLNTPDNGLTPPAPKKPVEAPPLEREPELPLEPTWARGRAKAAE